MKRYSHLQVLTVRELEVGDILHAGRNVGICVEWRVFKIANDKSYCIAQIGNSNTYLKLTGKEIRDPAFPMFRKADCPFCPTAQLEEAKYHAEPSLMCAPELQASDIPSVLGNIESVRTGQNPNTGAARYRSRSQRRSDIVERAERALRQQTS